MKPYIRKNLRDLDKIIDTLLYKEKTIFDFKNKLNMPSEFLSDYILPINTYSGELFGVFNPEEIKKFCIPIGFNFEYENGIEASKIILEENGLKIIPYKGHDILRLDLKLTGVYVENGKQVLGVEGKHGLNPLALIMKKDGEYRYIHLISEGKNVEFDIVSGNNLHETLSPIESVFTRLPILRLSDDDTLMHSTKKDDYNIEWDDPTSIVSYLNQYVIGQGNAKKTLAVAFSNYMIRKYHNDETIPKNNILLIGPSGCGKTYMISLLAKKAGLPMSIQSLSGKSAEGYIGENLSTFWKGFREKTAGVSPYGVVFLDELDKLVENVSTVMMKQSLQETLLGWIEDGNLNFTRESHYSNIKPLNTKNVLFIFAGAFNGFGGETDKLLRIINKRVNPNNEKIGFNRYQGNSKLEFSLHDVMPSDLVQYGLMTELVGRITSIAALDSLTEEDKVNILQNSKDSILKQYTHLLKKRGYALEIEKEVPYLIAKACPPTTGARALKIICDKLFTEIIYGIKQISDEKKHIILTSDYVSSLLNNHPYKAA